jgi:gliding motility-associated-like protein
LNGNITGGDLSVLTGRNLSDGDKIYCMMMTKDAACGNNEWGFSNLEIITVKPAPEIQFTDSVILIRPGQQAQLQATVDNGFISYSWQPPSDLIDANTLNPMTVPLLENKIFQLSVTASDGCISERNVLVKIYFHLAMPNAFTPDGNGKNDLFRIPPKTTMTLHDFSIYDRWGTRVFSTKDMGRGWDGTFNGMPVPAGAFVYIINGQDLSGEILAKGSFLLIR